MEDDIFECDKFDDCTECKNRWCENICNFCEVGEDFEPEDMDEVDTYFVGRV